MLFFVHLWPPRWVANELLEQFWYYYCLMFKFVSCSEIFRCDKYAKKRTKEQILFHSSIHRFFPKSSCGRYCYCLPADICLNSMIYSCCNKWIHTNSSANEMLQQPNLKWCPCWWTGSLNNPMLWDHIGNWLTWVCGAVIKHDCSVRVWMPQQGRAQSLCLPYGEAFIRNTCGN